MITRHLRISGLVQGVGYRWSMVEEATRLGLDGWVRNRRDGSVEAIARGDPATLIRLTEWAHRGPPGARVEKVIVCDCDDIPPPGFHQYPTV
ncbi:MAG TPA: acylphosphatase [Rhodocyclaceae bacterium]|jgi:acylphosphatase|nr:acylphosphatase [Rhodocyclaceae bacterium]